MKKARSSVVFGAVLLASLSLAWIPASASESGSIRENNIEKIRSFLNNKEVTVYLEKEKGISVDQLMDRIDSLSDEQIEELAKNTPDLLKLGSGTTNVESKSAEKISRDWMDFADKWLMIGLIFSVVMVLLVL